MSPATRTVLCAGVALLLAGGSSAAPVPAGSRAPFAPPLAVAPLEGTLDVAGGFCEYRRGHFHAGYDLGTGRRVGRLVRAPLAGSIERVRASGVGYGRSLYLRADDGRLLVFGHLDAYAPAIAAYVRGIQDSTLSYEQDLWPPLGRFRFEAGDTLAWTGESGAGGPHLHVEIRRGDVAYHPGRAGIAVADTAPPTLSTLTLEPLDAASRVAGSAGPRTFMLAARETIEVTGRVRAVLGARDGVWAGVDRMVPWEAGLEWRGEQVVCRFDSVSWATDMEQGDWLYDAGRVSDSKGIVLWSRAGARPRVLLTSAPLPAEAGTIHVRRGDAPRVLRLWARDLGGQSFVREVVLRPERAPHTSAAAKRAQHAEPWGDPALTFAALPGGAVRLSRAEARGSRAPDFRWGARVQRASRSDAGWSAVFQPERSDSLGVGIGWSAPAAGERGAGQGAARAWRLSPTQPALLRDSTGARTLQVGAGVLFEEATLVSFEVPVVAAGELQPLSNGWRVEPERLPLQRTATCTVPLAPGMAQPDVGLYRRSEGEWQWIGAASDSAAARLSATTRQLGTFGLFRDRLAPRVLRWQVTPDTSGLPYSRWAIEAVLEEAGSGVAARNSWIEWDGQRVPSEWDPEASCLRWRPLRPPGPGMHTLRIVAVDRAANVTRTEASVTLPR